MSILDDIGSRDLIESLKPLLELLESGNRRPRTESESIDLTTLLHEFLRCVSFLVVRHAIRLSTRLPDGLLEDIRSVLSDANVIVFCTDNCFKLPLDGLRRLSAEQSFPQEGDGELNSLVLTVNADR